MSPGAAGTAARGGYIAGRWYDSVFFIGAPVLALAVGLALGPLPEQPWIGFLLGAFIFAHLFLVFARSHLNTQIFRQHPVRFIAVPLLLFVALGVSEWLLIIGSVVAVLWDVYHSGMQTFGLARIYDARAGNPPLEGRRLDWALNVLLYAGPIAAGASLMDHLEVLEGFADVEAALFTNIPAYAESHTRWLTAAALVAGIPFLVYYVVAFARLRRRGYRLSRQKVILLVSTGAVSIWAWGFNPFGMAFFIMNAFHALQYFAIVWWAERRNLIQVLRLQGSAAAAPLALGMMIAVSALFGVWAEAADTEDGPWLLSIILVVSLMHFWYDGFIWSVRRKQV